MQYFKNTLVYFVMDVKYTHKMLMKLRPVANFIKYFIFLTHLPCKVSQTDIHLIHAHGQYFQNELTYFTIAIRYARKMLMKLTHVVNFINT